MKWSTSWPVFVHYDVEMYSLSTNAWKEIKLDYFPWIIRDETSSLMYNEHLHWIAHNWEREESVILSFDVVNSELEEIKLPDHGTDYLCFHLSEWAVVLKECLYYVYL